jgi:hypothetical protein
MFEDNYNTLSMTIFERICAKDYSGVNEILLIDPLSANAGIPFDQMNPLTKHPLHRICDAVFSGALTDDEGLKMADIFLKYESDVNGGINETGKDNPLIAASSLHADRVGVLLIEHGANINHKGTHGGTALHWAAWCGRPVLVEKLIASGAEINLCCSQFESTPIFWTIHGYLSSGKINLQEYALCLDLMIKAGADKSIPNKDGKTSEDLLGKYDLKLKVLLSP